MNSPLVTTFGEQATYFWKKLLEKKYEKSLKRMERVVKEKFEATIENMELPIKAEDYEIRVELVIVVKSCPKTSDNLKK